MASVTALTLVDWTSLGGVAFAAVAAGASWASVRQGARIWRASLQADLRAQFAFNLDKGQHEFVVSNFGGGAARAAGYFFVVGDGFVTGVLGYAGFVRPGVTLTISSRFELTEARKEARGILQWREADGAVWAWDMATDEKRRVLKPGRRRLMARIPTMRQTFAAFHPEHDIASLERFPATEISRSQS